MKICHVLWGLAFGGIETMIINITAEQARLGHKVYMLVIGDELDESLLQAVHPDVRVIRLGRRRGSKNPLPILRLYATLARIRPDVVHLHQLQMQRFIRSWMAPRVVATQHNDYIDGLDAHLGRGVELFSISNSISRHLAERYGYDSPVVINGIDMSAFRRRSEYFAGGRTFRIVNVGRLEGKLVKGQDVLIRAVAELRQRGLDVSADLIGEGPARRQFLQLIDSLGVGDSVRLLGARDQAYIRGHLADYDLFVQPSRMEGFGLSAVEAMAAGVPVLVSDIDALLEVTDHGRCGYSFRTEDTDSLAQSIADIMANYEPAITARAYDHARANYDVTATARNYIAAYK